MVSKQERNTPSLAPLSMKATQAIMILLCTPTLSAGEVDFAPPPPAPDPSLLVGEGRRTWEHVAQDPRLGNQNQDFPGRAVPSLLCVTYGLLSVPNVNVDKQLCLVTQFTVSSRSWAQRNAIIPITNLRRKFPRRILIKGGLGHHSEQGLSAAHTINQG